MDAKTLQTNANQRRADAITMLVHAARVREDDLRPKAKGTVATPEDDMVLEAWAQRGFAGTAAPSASFKVMLRQDIDELTGAGHQDHDEDSPRVGGAWNDTRD